ESLPLLVDKLNEYGLRERIRVIASGKLINPSDVTWALCMGADFIVSARGFMFTLGCIQALQCNKNTCPTGITTHDRKLQRGLDPELKSTRVASYVKNMIYEVGMIAHACGISSPREFRRHHARVVQENGLSLPLQACLRPRDRFWDIPVPKIDSAFDNLLVPQPSWSPSTTQQLRKLVAAPYLAPNDWTPRSEAYFVFPLAQGTPGKQCGLAATGVYQPSLRSPWLAADELFPPTIPADGEQ
ncbi:glutamate synthase-related protein, partial [Thiolapillus sp.]